MPSSRFPDPKGNIFPPSDRSVGLRKASRPLSIAMVAPCPFPTRQGTQVLIRHIANALGQTGHNIHLISYGYGEYEEESYEFEHVRSARVHAGLRSGPHLLKPAADAALLLTAGRVIRSQRCDLIHAHNVEGLGIGALLKLQHSIPLIYHAHNAMGPELPTYFRAQLAQAFASLVGDVIDRTLPLAADAVVAFDPDHKALHEVYGMSADRIHVIPPGIDANEIRSSDPEPSRRLEGELGEKTWLLYAGNPDGYQNLPLMWKAYGLVRARRPDVGLLLATNQPQASFVAEMRENGSPDGVVIRHVRDLPDLQAAHAIASIALCPRVLWTGAPIKLLNYLAAGIPVVACKGAARHLVGERCGILVDDDPEDFAAGILKLLDHPPDRRRLVRAFERFQIQSHVPLYEAMYADVLAAHRKSGARQKPPGGTPIRQASRRANPLHPGNDADGASPAAGPKPNRRGDG